MTDVLTKLRIVHRAWRHRLRVDRAEIRFMLSEIQPGDTVVDAGAHKGSHTYWLCQTVGRSGCVLAFEPQPLLAEYLRDVGETFPFPQLKCFAAALSDQAGEAPLSINAQRHSGTASLLPGTGSRHAVSVKLLSLDDCARDHAAGPVRFIKIDVEGHELEVLRGAERVLKEDRPSLLLECVEGYHGRVSTDEVFSYLKELGYGGGFFHRGRLRSLSRFSPSRHQVKMFTPDWCPNFAFVPTERLERSALHRAA